MPHYRQLLDPSEWIGPQDVTAPRIVTISRVTRELADESATFSPVMYFKNGAEEEAPKKYKIPRSVLFGLSHVFGTDTDNWAGQSITLYLPHCVSFGELEECVRVQFSDDVNAKIKKWLKRKGVSPLVYLAPAPQ